MIEPGLLIKLDNPRAVPEDPGGSNSHQHQGVDGIGSSQVPVAWSAAGLMEAVERHAGEP